MNNQEILTRAVAALNSHLYSQLATIDYKGGVPYLTVMGKRFVCMVDPDLTLGKMVDTIPDFYKQPDKDTRYLYVTVNATPRMLDLARHPDINVLDCAGNFNIQFQEDKGYIMLMLANKGEEPIEDTTPKAYPIFMEKGLRVIFYLLMNKKNITRPYREIVAATGVSIGTVKNVIDGLIYQQFVRAEDNKRFLINADRLLMLWATNYGQILKPKLLQTRFTFRNPEKRKDWRAMALPDGMAWGGEPAAALTDGYLTPGEFTVYTEIPAATLMKTGVVIPDANGEICVYRKFWKNEDIAKTTPVILTYADLMDTANSRCVEAAQKLKENELQYLL